MASINGVGSSSSISGLYNSANIISGLASGLDTEGMIESLVKSYQNKIQTLNNKATKLGWKQEAYQSIISKAYAFSSKYTSYMSGTNLLAASFFNSAVNVKALGKFADKIAASGRTDSDVKVNSVKQLATSARYSPTAGALKDLGGESYIAAVKGSDWSSDAGLDLAGDQINLGTLHGSLSFTYGSQTVSISFDEVSDYGKITGATAEEKAESLAKLIEDKLADQTVSLTGGTTASAADRIKVDVQDGKLVFSDKSTAKNSVYISGASGTVAGVLGLSSDDLENADEVKPDSITLKDDTDSYTQFSRKETAYQYLSGKNFNVNVDGTTKTLRGPVITKAGDGTYTITTATTVKDKYGNVGYAYGDPSKIDTNKYSIVKKGEVVTGVKEDELAQKYTDVLSQAASDAFGKKLTVSNASTDPSKLSLKFEVADGSNLLINADMGEALGIGKVATNYLNTNSTLGELMRGDGSMWDQMTPNKDGKYDFVLNGVTIGSYDKDTKLSTIISDINANSDANVNVSYSKTTREFVFTSKDTGSENGITLGKGLASALFGGGAGAAAAQKTPKELLGANTVVGEKVSLKIDGKEYGFELTKDDSSMERVLNTLNGPKGGLNAAGYTAKFSDIDGSLIVTDKDGKAETKVLGPLNEQARNLLPQHQDIVNRLQLVAGPLNDRVMAEMDIEKPFEGGKAALWTYVDLLYLENEKPLPTDSRFMVRSDVCGHCYQLNELLFDNSEEIVLDRHNPRYDGPRGADGNPIFSIVVDSFDGEMIHAWHIETVVRGRVFKSDNLAFNPRNNVDVLMGVNGTTEGFLRANMLERSAYQEYWRTGLHEHAKRGLDAWMAHKFQ